MIGAMFRAKRPTTWIADHVAPINAISISEELVFVHHGSDVR
jgi:hypothetical protein